MMSIFKHTICLWGVAARVGMPAATAAGQPGSHVNTRNCTSAQACDHPNTACISPTQGKLGRGTACNARLLLPHAQPTACPPGARMPMPHPQRVQGSLFHHCPPVVLKCTDLCDTELLQRPQHLRLLPLLTQGSTQQQLVLRQLQQQRYSAVQYDHNVGQQSAILGTTQRGRGSIC